MSINLSELDHCFRKTLQKDDTNFDDDFLIGTIKRPDETALCIKPDGYYYNTKPLCARDEYKNTVICACVNSKIMNPACNDPKCRYSIAYKTSTMKEIECPEETVKIYNNPNNVSVQGEGNVLTTNQVNQRKTDSIITPAGNPAPGPTFTNNRNQELGDSLSLEKIFNIIEIKRETTIKDTLASNKVLIIIIFIIIIAFLLFSCAFHFTFSNFHKKYNGFI